MTKLVWSLSKYNTENRLFLSVFDNTTSICTEVGFFSRCYYYYYTKSCTWVTPTPHNPTACGESGWKVTQWRKTWFCSWTWASSVFKRPRGSMASWLVSEKVWPAGPGEQLFPRTQTWWGHASTAVSSSGPLIQEWHCGTGASPEKGN